MAGLLLDSLEIKGFRAFHDLRVEKLGRVNLIVGPNNVGKTCLLEALQIYAGRAHPSMLWQLLQDHDEDTTGKMLSDVQNLFYLSPEMTTETVEPITIGPIDQPKKTLRLAVGFYIADMRENGQPGLRLLSPDEKEIIPEAVPYFSVQLGTGRPVIYSLGLTTRLPKPEIPLVNCLLVDTHDFSAEKLATLWDAIAATEQQQEVLRALRIAIPSISDVNISEVLNTKQERYPVVEISGDPQFYPMRTFGEGIQRILAIVLSLLNARDGLLLIDEIEHGLYYQGQVKLWDLIFQIAQQLNIQVFATSHNWDCIVAFHNAITLSDQRKAQSDTQSDDQETDAMLFRLRLQEGESSAVLYDKRRLCIAAQQVIEVR